MVYVDPDPEIGAPPPAVGWVEQPAARLEPEGDPGGPSDAPSADGAQSPTEANDGATGLGDAETGDSPGVGAPDEDVDIAEAEEAAEAQRMVGVEEATGTQELAEAEVVALAGLGGERERTRARGTSAGTVEAEDAPATVGPSAAGNQADGRTVPDVRDRTDAEAFAKPTDDTPGEVVLGAGSRADASEATGSSDADGVPWNEQALPMAWSPG